MALSAEVEEAEPQREHCEMKRRTCYLVFVAGLLVLFTGCIPGATPEENDDTQALLSLIMATLPIDSPPVEVVPLHILDTLFPARSIRPRSSRAHAARNRHASTVRAGLL